MIEPIHISTAARRRDNNDSAGASSTRLRAACAERAVNRLTASLAALFEEVDDALFQLAEQSSNNIDQNRYFEGMREVRLRRSAVEDRYRATLLRRFDEAAGGTASERDTGVTGLDTVQSLSLVAHDDLEQSLAIDNLIARIEGECADELWALDQRMASLLGRTAGSTGCNPLAPDALCRDFREACAVIEVEIEIRLLIFKLFDHTVAATLARYYQDMNTFLTQNGVLPTVQAGTAGPRPTPRIRTPRRREASPAPSHPEPAVPAMDGHTDASNTAAIAAFSPGARTAMGTMQVGTALPGSGSPGAGIAAGGTPGAHVAGAPAGDLLAILHQIMTAQGARALSGNTTGGGSNVTMRLLTDLQHGVAGAAPAGGLATTIDAERLAAGTTNVLRELRDTAVDSDIGRVDAMMIDIVALLFDSILDDAAIPGPMKALIGRLQIPVLKVAILDKTFFARKFHPARQLLNNLAEAAVGAAEDADVHDPLYVAINAIVHRILDEFDDDIRVFKRAVQELETYRANEQRAADSRVEQTLQETLAEERLRFARHFAGEKIAAHLDGETLPAIVREFLEVYWKGYLQLVYVDGGEDSPQWASALETLDDLVWSLTPKDDMAACGRLREMLPTLPARLKEGMQRVPVPEDFRERFTSTLVRLHLAAIRGPGARDTVPPDAGNAAHVPGTEPDNQGQTGTADEAFFDPTGVSPDPDDTATEDAIAADDPEAAFVDAVAAANRRILETAAARPECEGMGTTLVAARFSGDHIIMAHVGDSRLYRLREGSLQQLTADHSLRQELVDQGFYTPEEARVSTRKNYITRAVGIDETVRTDTRTQTVATGDCYLLCSDGLCDMVADEEMAAILQDHPQALQAAAQALVDRANENGGKDNISVILVAVPETAGDGTRHWTMTALTDVGCTRSHNEDYVACDAAAGLAVLADGMGGYNAGEVASELAVTTVMGALGANVEPGDGPDAAIREMLFGDGPVEVEEITLTAPPPAAEQAPSADDFPPLDAAFEEDPEEIEIHDIGGGPPETAEDEHLQAVRDLRIGNWIEFRQQSGKRVRARLTWISSATGCYLFSNRHGHKVADTTPQGLAVEFRRGSARRIANAPLFDRAVAGLMQRLHGDSADPWA